MLQLTIAISPEMWDEDKEVFIDPVTETIELEHSLVSISKWESNWNRAFLTNRVKTPEETVDYIKCMTLTPNVDPEVYNHLTNEHVNLVNEYMGKAMSATVIRDVSTGKKNNDVTTAELIYYWMTTLNIPFECETWHLNKLLVLIRVSSVKNAPQKRISNKSILQQNRALNEARRKQHNTRG